MKTEYLVLGGERVPAADGKTFAVIEPALGKHFAEVAEAGHHLMLDQPEQTVVLVREFLQRHRLLQGAI